MKNVRRMCQLIGWSSVVTLALIFTGACRSPEPKPSESVSPELDGAWHRTSSETIGPDGSRYPGRTHESFLLISDGFYSMNWAFGPEASDFYADRSVRLTMKSLPGMRPCLSTLGVSISMGMYLRSIPPSPWSQNS